MAESSSMYIVSGGGQTLEYPTREEAIEAAKKLSQEAHGEVTVADGMDHERLAYRRGKLEHYVLQQVSR
jgi:hypothetical protein